MMALESTLQMNLIMQYIIDTKSDIRENPKLSGTVHNVFGIQLGIAIMFLVRKESLKKPCMIQYFALEDEQRREEKLRWFASNKVENVPFVHITPDKKGNWLNIQDNDFDDLLPLVPEKDNDLSIFTFYTIGVSTNRDEWVFDFDESNIADKIQYFVESYNSQLKRLRDVKPENLGNALKYDIQWSRALKDKIPRRVSLNFDGKSIIEFNYRPYVKKLYYSDKDLSDFLTRNHYKIFGDDLNRNNKVICFSGVGSSTPFSVLISNRLFSKDLVENTQAVPYFFNNGKKWSKNVTEWAIRVFREQYKDDEISSDSIFNYVYAILHSPKYCQKYDADLKRQLPRIPLMKDFWKWENWGQQLINLHIDFENAPIYPLERIDKETKNIQNNKPRLLANRNKGEIAIDDITTLKGIPKQTWAYKIRNRTAVEWILDQYKEKTPKSETLRKNFNNYSFEDYKGYVIELIQKVVTVSLETTKIIKRMEEG